MADGPGGLGWSSISGIPAAPRLAGTWDSPGESMGLVLREKLVYLADGSAGLQIVDVKDPQSPRRSGSLDTDGTAEGIALSGSVCLYRRRQLPGSKLSTSATRPRRGRRPPLTASGYAQSVSVDGKYLCAGSLYDGGFQIFDIADPAAPVVVSTNKYTMYNEGWKVDLERKSRSMSWIISRASFSWTSPLPKNPRRSGHIFTPSSIIAAAAVQDGYAYAVGELSGLQVVDLSDPARPSAAGSTTIFRGVQGLAVSGRYAYVTDRWSVRIFDVADPAKPKPPQAVEHAGGRAPHDRGPRKHRLSSRPTTPDFS